MKLTRREVLQAGTATLLTLPALAQAAPAQKLSLGLITDIHNAPGKAGGTRFFGESMVKVKEATNFFRQQKPDAIVELGDLVDGVSGSTELQKADLESVIKELKSSGSPVHCVLGNHCTDRMTKPDFLRIVGQRSGHISLRRQGWRLILLDACYRVDGVSYAPGNYRWTDTFIPDWQQDWLKAELAGGKEPVLVFCHQRLDQEDKADTGVKNASDIRKILESSRRVAGVFMGHTHTNEHQTLNGIHYVTLAAVVEGSGEANNGYSLLEANPDGSLRLIGQRKHADNPFAKR